MTREQPAAPDRPPGADSRPRSKDGPELSTPRVGLRLLRPDDYYNLHQLETVGELAWRWRQQGRVSSPEGFVNSLWTGVLAQFIIEDPSTTPLGLVLAYDADHRNGVCKIGVLRFNAEDPRPSFMLGVALFIDYVFYYWPFRKLYAEASETSFEQYASGERTGLFAVEGRLGEYVYRDGGYEDLLVFAIARRNWDEQRQRWAALMNRSSGLSVDEPWPL